MKNETMNLSLVALDDIDAPMIAIFLAGVICGMALAAWIG